MDDPLQKMYGLLNNLRSLYPDVRLGNQPCSTGTKSAQVSKEARNEGNSWYTQRPHSRHIHQNIFSLYSKSIAFAPNGSEELALGYSNRSALWHHVKKFQLSLIDIDRALKLTQTAALRAKLACRKVDCLMNVDKQAAKAAIKEAKDYIVKIDDADVELKKKLEESLIQSMKITKHSQPTEFDPESLMLDLPNFKSNEELIDAHSAVRLEYNEEYGRHLIAGRNIKTGEILVVQKCYAAVPNIENLYVTCLNCMNIAWNGIPCDFCSCVIFCSQECKNEAWVNFHDLECPILQKLITLQNVDPKPFGVLRILVKAFKESSANDKLEYIFSENSVVENCSDSRKKGFINDFFDSNKFRALLSLQYSEEMFQQDIKTCNTKPEFTTIFEGLKNFIKQEITEDQKNLLRKLIIKCFWIYEINAYMYCANYCSCQDSEEGAMYGDHKPTCFKTIGSLLSPLSCLFNHSCTPNVYRVFRDGKVILYTLRPVKANEQLFISYCSDIQTPKKDRQRYLKLKFGFTCHCIACQENWPVRVMNQNDAWELNQFLLQVSGRLSEREMKKPIKEWKSYRKIIAALKEKIDKLSSQNSLKTIEQKFYLFTSVFNEGYEIFYGISPIIPKDC